MIVLNSGLLLYISYYLFCDSYWYWNMFAPVSINTFLCAR